MRNKEKITIEELEQRLETAEISSGSCLIVLNT